MRPQIDENPGNYDPNEGYPGEYYHYDNSREEYLLGQVKTFATLALALLDRESHPFTHVNGVRVEDAIKMAEMIVDGKEWQEMPE